MIDSTKITIKKAEINDLVRIEAIAKEIWTEHYTPIIGADQVTYMLDKYQSAVAMERDITYEGYQYFMAIAEDRLVGYCAVLPDEEALFLSKIYIHKDFRSKGIARLFLNKAAEIVHKYQLSSIYLTVNKQNSGSIAAYQKLGFVITDEVVTDIGEQYVMDDYVMKKTIK